MSLMEIQPTVRAEPDDGGTTQPCTVTARDLMSTPVQTIDVDATMSQAWALMLEGGHRHLVVCSRGRCRGVLDDRTLFAHWPTGPFGLEASPLRDLLRPRTSCVLPAASAATVASIMATQGVDSVPVTDEDGGVVGVVTSSDLAAAVAEHGLCRRP
jgi:tRNA nucleotidyltransferase (CCA-adding enzyme)